MHDTEAEAARGPSPLSVLLIVALVLLLGAAGALFGINVANQNKRAAADIIQQGFATPTGSAPVTAAPTPTLTPAPSSTPAATVTPTPAATATPSAEPVVFTLPDLAGLDFMAARATVGELTLGWRMVFEGMSDDHTVRATEPAAGSTVRQGDTVKILVAGSAPAVTVPSVIGLSCRQADIVVVDRGLHPQYPTGREGVVVDQAPAATDDDATDGPMLHWNDEVTIGCG